MRILVADNLPSEELAPLRADGHHVEIDAALTPETLVDVIAGYDALVVRSTKVPAPVIEAATTLALIVRSGAGTDTIDVDAAAAKGIYVCNVPGQNSVAVAELTMGLLIAVDRQIPSACADLRSHQWNKAQYSNADGLFGKSMAIIGLGAIGFAVAERAKAFGITVLARRRPDRGAEAEQKIRALGIRLFDNDAEMLSEADIVSVHVPKTSDTVRFIDRDFFAKMKPGAIFLNTSRGELVDGDALLEALNGGLRAGLDVYPDEPTSATDTYQSQFASHPNIVGTPHIGASTAQAQAATVAGTVATIRKFVQGSIENCVNLEYHPLGDEILTIRHADRVGVLASVFSVLRNHGVNVQQMSNQVFRGADAAVASMNLDGSLDDELLEEIRGIDAVFGVQTSCRKTN